MRAALNIHMSNPGTSAQRAVRSPEIAETAGGALEGLAQELHIAGAALATTASGPGLALVRRLNHRARATSSVQYPSTGSGRVPRVLHRSDPIGEDVGSDG